MFTVFARLEFDMVRVVSDSAAGNSYNVGSPQLGIFGDESLTLSGFASHLHGDFRGHFYLELVDFMCVVPDIQIHQELGSKFCFVCNGKEKRNVGF
jgi:hypothetical protein